MMLAEALGRTISGRPPCVLRDAPLRALLRMRMNEDAIDAGGCHATSLLILRRPQSGRLEGRTVPMQLLDEPAAR
jgi:hypothetical protein